MVTAIDCIVNQLWVLGVVGMHGCSARKGGGAEQIGIYGNCIGSTQAGP